MIFLLKGLKILRPSSGMDCDGDSLLAGYQHLLRPSGHRWNTTDSTIGKNDLWIAAHAKAAYLTIVTNNNENFDA
jgi:predicted nucleic acid-binding protein